MGVVGGDSDGGDVKVEVEVGWVEVLGEGGGDVKVEVEVSGEGV